MSLSEPESPKTNDTTDHDQTKVFTVSYQCQVQQSWPTLGVDPSTPPDHTHKYPASPPTLDHTPGWRKNTPPPELKRHSRDELMTSDNSSQPIRHKGSSHNSVTLLIYQNDIPLLMVQDHTEAKPKALPRSKYKSDYDPELKTQPTDKLRYHEFSSNRPIKKEVSNEHLQCTSFQYFYKQVKVKPIP